MVKRYLTAETLEVNMLSELPTIITVRMEAGTLKWKSFLKIIRK